MLSPVTTVIPLQILAYHIAALRGLDVDQPRDLAALLRHGATGHTGRLLQQWPQQRLKLALESLADVDDYPDSGEIGT